MTTRIERLRATLDSVRQHGPEHFDMVAWYQDSAGRQHLVDVVRVCIEDCGTTACLAGHANLAHIRLEGTHLSEPFWLADWLGLPELLFMYWGPRVAEVIEDEVGDEVFVDSDGRQCVMSYDGRLHPLCPSLEPHEQWEWAIGLLEREIKLEEEATV